MESLEKRFWKRVDKTTTPDGCWEWAGTRNVWNYGKITVQGKTVGAHRIAWELTNGPVPERLEVLHKCDNPPCCHPDHLFTGTQSVNILDSVQKGRQIGNTGHKKIRFTLEQVEEIKRSNLSQRKIAEKFNVNQSTISRALNSKGGWSKC